MLNYYEYEHRLNEMTFDNFILDESNKVAYAKFFEMSQDNKYVGRRIVVTGPKKTGKSHLTISLLDSLLRNNPNLKIKKMHGTDFAARVTWDAGEKNYDISQKIDEYFIDELLENDILVICNVNDISHQLSTEGHIKMTFCRLLDQWESTNKTFIITIFESSEWQVKNDDVLSRLGKFEQTITEKYDKSLIKKWLDRAISWSLVELESSVYDSILNESVNITHCRNLLQQYYSERKSEHFVMIRPAPSVEQILDFGIGKQNGYTRILDYEKINNSERTRKYLVYFLDKYTDMSRGEIAKTLRINTNVVSEDLIQCPPFLDDQEKGLLELYNEVLLSWWDDCYHMENNHEWI